MEALNRYLRGWMGYYALIEIPSIVKESQSWLRRRMRLVVWHQWKKPIARYRNLRKLGLSHGLAMEGACTVVEHDCNRLTYDLSPDSEPFMRQIIK